MSKRTDFLSKKGKKSITTTTEGVSHTTSPCLPKRGATERRGLLKKIPLMYPSNQARSGGCAELQLHEFPIQSMDSRSRVRTGARPSDLL